MKRKPYRRARAFFSAFMLTLCLLLLASGFWVVEYNTRRTAFGETRLTALRPKEDAAPPAWLQTLAGRIGMLVPARLRAAVWIGEAERAAVPPLLQWLDNLRRPEAAQGEDGP